MKLKILVVALLFLLVLNLATIGTLLYFRFNDDSRENGEAFAHRPHQPPPRGPGNGPGGEGGPPPMRLSHEEREQLKELLDRFGDQTLDMKTRIHSLENETLTLMKEDPGNRQEIDSLLQEISDTQLAISGKAVDILLEAKSFLTDEQSRLFYDAILRARPEPHGMMPPPPHGDDRLPRGDR